MNVPPAVVHDHHLRRHRTRDARADLTARTARETLSPLESILSLGFVGFPRVWMVLKVPTTSVPALETVQA